MEAGFPQQRVLLGVDLTVVGVLELDGGDVADLAMDADVVEPPHPVQGGELEVVDPTPRSFVTDGRSAVDGVERLGQEPPRGQPQHVGAAARAVIGGHEVVADEQR